MKATLISTVLVWALASTNVFAQSGCTQSLADARTAYENGNFLEALDLVEDCIGNYKTKEEKVEANRIAALCYMELGKDGEVHKHIRNIFRADPNYQRYTVGKDPRRFSKLVLEYEVRPSLQLGFYAGGTLNIPKVSESLVPYNSGTSTYTPSVGYQFGADIDALISGGWSVRGKVGFSSAATNHTIQKDDNTRVVYFEAFNWMDIIAGCNYTHHLNDRFAFYGGLNLGSSYVIGSHSVVAIEDDITNGREEFSTTHKEAIQKMRFFSGVGIGVESDLNSGILRVGLDFRFYHTVQAKRDVLLNSIQDQWLTYYTPDLTKFRASGIQVSYLVPVSYRISK